MECCIWLNGSSHITTIRTEIEVACPEVAKRVLESIGSASLIRVIELGGQEDAFSRYTGGFDSLANLEFDSLK